MWAQYPHIMPGRLSILTCRLCRLIQSEWYNPYWTLLLIQGINSCVNPSLGLQLINLVMFRKKILTACIPFFLKLAINIPFYQSFSLFISLYYILCRILSFKFDISFIYQLCLDLGQLERKSSSLHKVSNIGYWTWISLF